MVNFFDSSADAQMPAKRGFKPKYAWRELPVGKSFHVAHGDIKFNSLCVLAARTGKKLNRKFRVVDHGEAQGMEVARLPDAAPEMTFTTSVAEVKLTPASDSPWKVKE